PVSTNPMGARILADGKPAGQTPGTVSLERNKDHILTIVKENYQQVDVVINRQYQSNKVLMKAVQSGVNSGLFFKNAGMGMNSGFNSISNQEATGEAYVLIPPSVAVTLIPKQGQAVRPPQGSPYPAAPSAAPPARPAANTDIPTKDLVQAGVIAGAAVGASQAKPIEKKWETSSSSRTYREPDGTVVTKKSSTSVSVGVNPAGLIGALDTLFSK
ncbi:MAG TPA: PEGA domain-containing protein, partial [Syntrophorhabdaceae bacterium]|nr:PEGA domain-containing protein [Syntrophorhabdaceae bacterium]